MIPIHTQGLIPATYTPLRADGSLNTDLIPSYAQHLKSTGVVGIFISGTTGEGLLLSLAERKELAEAWMPHQDANFKVMIHVGASACPDACELADHARSIGAAAIGTMGPNFLPPNSLNELIDYCREIANAGGELPFYYYHIPPVSGVNASMITFLREAQQQIPTLAGIKYSHHDLMEMAQCVTADGGKWDILFGRDEILVSGLALGVQSAIGSTYNYMAPLYQRIIVAFGGGDLRLALELQRKAIAMVDLLIQNGGGVGGGKPIMKMIGLDCGPVRTPVRRLSDQEVLAFEKALKGIGFFEWGVK